MANRAGAGLDLSDRYERTVALVDAWMGEGGDAIDLSTLAQVAALAAEYAEKVEAGTATGIEVTTLTCHCVTLAEDLYALALAVGSGRSSDVPTPSPSGVQPEAVLRERPSRAQGVASSASIGPETSAVG